MALALFVNFTVEAGAEEEAKDLIRRMEEHTRHESGCLEYIGHQSVEDPCRFAFYELYEDEAALDAHRASSHFAQYVTNGLARLMKSSVRELFHTIE